MSLADVEEVVVELAIAVVRVIVEGGSDVAMS